MMTLPMIAFLLIACHFLMDFPLQGEAVAINKNRRANTPLQQHVGWGYWAFAHAASHGFAVALITGNPLFGILETIAHFVIDFMKCEKMINIHEDQIMHLLCKVLWFVLLIKSQ